MEKVDLQDRFSNTKLTQLWLKKKSTQRQRCCKERNISLHRK